jgi:hypothetical protein
MMDCTQHRRAMLADPRDTDPELRVHRETCADCTEYAGQLWRFDTRLDRALRIEVGERLTLPSRGRRILNRFGFDRPAFYRPGLGRTGSPRPALDRRGWLAVALGLLLAVGVASVLWLAIPGPSLAADLVTHMGGEPQAWRRTDEAVPASALTQVLRDARVRLTPGAGVVTYAASCSFRGHQVPHLVVQDDAGPATVMVLAHESVPAVVHFDEQGYRGVIVPVPGHGSLAVLTRGQAADINGIQRILARLLASIDWTT